MLELNKAVAECHVINLPSSVPRRKHMVEMLSHHGVAFSFIDGVVANSHAMGCAQSHLNAINAISKLPSLILEDDAAPMTDTLEIPPIPKDADIIYLGSSVFGCSPRRRPYVRRFGHRALFNMALSSSVDENWQRLHSMAGMIAILYVSQKGVDAWRKAARSALRRSSPIDVFTTYLMNSVNVYTTHQPIFYEAMELQRKPLFVTPEQRRAWWTTPIRPSQAGKIVKTAAHGKQIQARVICPEGALLEWELIS